MSLPTRGGGKTNINILDDNGTILSQVRLSQGALQIGTGVNFGRWGTARVSLERSFGTVRRRIGTSLNPDIPFDETTFSASFSIDTVDNVKFPHRGLLFSLNYRNELSLLNGDSRVDSLLLSGYMPYSWGRNTLGLTYTLGTSFNGTPDETDLFPLGGFLSMTAYSPGQLTGNHGGSAGLVYYRRVAGGLRYLTQTPIYLGATLETGNLWNRTADISLNDLRWSSSLFVGADTLIGPVYLGAGYGSDNQAAIFLFVGQLF